MSACLYHIKMAKIGEIIKNQKEIQKEVLRSYNKRLSAIRKERSFERLEREADRGLQQEYDEFKK